MLVIISGPSGVGKDTIIDAMRERTPRPRVRLRRDLHDPRAAPGRDRWRRLPLRVARGVPAAARRPPAARDERGPRQLVRLAARPGAPRRRWPDVDAILKIDVQGAQIVKEQVTEALLIFVVPPTLETLFSRLRTRATESADELELRQRNAAIELARQDDYDYVVVNETGQVERTAERIDEIIAEERRLHADRRVRV